jgi:hypothetical protein
MKCNARSRSYFRAARIGRRRLPWQAHALLDALPAEKLNAVRSLLEVMVDPLARSLALALVEEEVLTHDTAAALNRARASLAREEGIPHDEILREFGLKQ